MVTQFAILFAILFFYFFISIETDGNANAYVYLSPGIINRVPMRKTFACRLHTSRKVCSLWKLGSWLIWVFYAFRNIKLAEYTLHNIQHTKSNPVLCYPKHYQCIHMILLLSKEFVFVNCT